MQTESKRRASPWKDVDLSSPETHLAFSLYSAQTFSTKYFPKEDHRRYFCHIPTESLKRAYQTQEKQIGSVKCKKIRSREWRLILPLVS